LQCASDFVRKGYIPREVGRDIGEEADALEQYHAYIEPDHVSKGGSNLMRKAANTSTATCSSTGSRFMSTTPPGAGDHKTGGTGAGLGSVRNRMISSARSSRSTLCKPMTYGQAYVGTDSGPSLLREAGLRGMLSALGWRVEDLPISRSD
jgi:hypothetical protein